MLTFLIALLLKVEAYSPTTALGALLILLTCVGPSLMTLHAFYDLYMGEDHGQSSMRTLTRLKHSFSDIVPLKAPPLPRIRTWSIWGWATRHAPQASSQGAAAGEVELKPRDSTRASKVRAIVDPPAPQDQSRHSSTPSPVPPALAATEGKPALGAAALFRRLTTPSEPQVIKEHEPLDLTLTDDATPQASDQGKQSDGSDITGDGVAPQPSDQGTWVANPMSKSSASTAVSL